MQPFSSRKLKSLTYHICWKTTDAQYVLRDEPPIHRHWKISSLQTIPPPAPTSHRGSLQPFRGLQGHYNCFGGERQARRSSNGFPHYSEEDQGNHSWRGHCNCFGGKSLQPFKVLLQSIIKGDDTATVQYQGQCNFQRRSLSYGNHSGKDHSNV